MKLPFTKMQAYGNDYIYINAIENEVVNPGLLSKKISDRHFGVGSDGLVLICASDVCDFRMRIFNPDGTEAEMCGNALRSMSKYVYDKGLTQKEQFTVETIGGIKRITLTVRDGVAQDIRADIGKPILEAAKIPVDTPKERFLEEPIQAGEKEFLVSSLSWGNPHTVTFVDNVDDVEIETYGPLLENHPRFPQRTNVTFAQIVDDGHIRIREWERGTGETLGCGTGCCTAVVIGALLGKCGRNVEVTQPGGVLKVEQQEDGTVFMQGPSHFVFEGVYEYEA